MNYTCEVLGTVSEHGKCSTDVGDITGSLMIQNYVWTYRNT